MDTTIFFFFLLEREGYVYIHKHANTHIQLLAGESTVSICITERGLTEDLMG